MDVGAAVEAVRGEIAAALRGRDPHDQAGVDGSLLALDGTREKSRLGANAMLATSLAVARAAAADAGVPLWRYLAGERPVPLLDVLNGGVHAANRLDFEEFMIVPAGADTFSDALRIGVEVFHELRYTLLARGRSVLMGADGGFAPDLESNESALGTRSLRSEARTTSPAGTCGSGWTPPRANCGRLEGTGWRTRGASSQAKNSPSTTTSSPTAIRCGCRRFYSDARSSTGRREGSVGTENRGLGCHRRRWTLPAGTALSCTERQVGRSA